MKIAITLLLGLAGLACAQESVHLPGWDGVADILSPDASNSDSPPYETVKKADLWEERRYFEGKRDKAACTSMLYSHSRVHRPCVIPHLGDGCVHGMQSLGL